MFNPDKLKVLIQEKSKMKPGIVLASFRWLRTTEELFPLPQNNHASNAHIHQDFHVKCTSKDDSVVKLGVVYKIFCHIYQTLAAEPWKSWFSHLLTWFHPHPMKVEDWWQPFPINSDVKHKTPRTKTRKKWSIFTVLFFMSRSQSLLFNRNSPGSQSCLKTSSTQN